MRHYRIKGKGKCMGRSREGHETRERLADTLLALMREKDARTIKVTELASGAGIDRQTFYHHFRDIHDLAGYAYDRALARLFGYENIADTYPLFDENYCTNILMGLEDRSTGMRDLALFMHRQNPRGHFYDVVQRNVCVDARPALEAKGIPADQVNLMCDILTASHVAIIISWLQGDMVVSGQRLGLVLRREHEAILSAFTL